MLFRSVKDIRSQLPENRELGIRDTPAFIALAHELREALAHTRDV